MRSELNCLLTGNGEIWEDSKPSIAWKGWNYREPPLILPLTDKWRTRKFFHTPNYLHSALKSGIWWSKFLTLKTWFFFLLVGHRILITPLFFLVYIFLFVHKSKSQVVQPWNISDILLFIYNNLIFYLTS